MLWNLDRGKRKKFHSTMDKNTSWSLHRTAIVAKAQEDTYPPINPVKAKQQEGGIHEKQAPRFLTSQTERKHLALKPLGGRQSLRSGKKQKLAKRPAHLMRLKEHADRKK
jgi:hypothetical protein